METDHRKNLKSMLEDQLFWDTRVASEHVEVELIDNDVRLHGFVPTYADKRHAELDAFAVSGIHNVINDLQVKNQESTTELPVDEEIREAIRHILQWNTQVEDADLAIKVENGMVSLEGSVKSYWEKIYTEELVTPVKGVNAVINKLTVVPSRNISDEVIAKDVMDAMDRNLNVDAQKINVNVEDGHVKLTGLVSSQPASRYAYEIALYTPGVIGVDSNIEMEL